MNTPTDLRYLLRCSVMLLVVSSAGMAAAQEAELPRPKTPLMGWSSWNHYGRPVTQADIEANADAMVSSGLRDLGYVYVNVDGGWQMSREADGTIGVNHERIQNMKAMADHIHAKGLKFGIYSGPGPLTCGKMTASYGHEEQDAQTFANWGADYLKYDLCSFHEMMLAKEKTDGHEASVELEKAAYKKMELALEKTKRPIVYAICQYGTDNVWTWAPSMGATMWRSTIDIANNWNSMTNVGFALAGLSKYANPGHYNDPDSLEIGNGVLKPDEERLQMSLWSMAAAPLILGNDVSHMDAETLAILSNKEVIAIDQDPLVKAADRIWAEGMAEIWTRPLDGGREAVALFNRGHFDLPMTLDLKQVGWNSRSAMARDVWAHQDVTVRAAKSFLVPKHGVVLLVLRKADE